jgi:hypothetical protein
MAGETIYVYDLCVRWHIDEAHKMKMTKLSMAPLIRHYPCCKFVLASNASQMNISLSDLIISSVLASFDPYLMKDKKYKYKKSHSQTIHRVICTCTFRSIQRASDIIHMLLPGSLHKSILKSLYKRVLRFIKKSRYH